MQGYEYIDELLNTLAKSDEAKKWLASHITEEQAEKLRLFYWDDKERSFLRKYKKMSEEEIDECMINKYSADVLPFDKPLEDAEARKLMLEGKRMYQQNPNGIMTFELKGI